MDKCSIYMRLKLIYVAKVGEKASKRKILTEQVWESQCKVTANDDSGVRNWQHIKCMDDFFHSFHCWQTKMLISYYLQNGNPKSTKRNWIQAHAIKLAGKTPPHLSAFPHFCFLENVYSFEKYDHTKRSFFWINKCTYELHKEMKKSGEKHLHPKA